MRRNVARLGVVGLRNIGTGHIRRAEPIYQAEIVAIADSNPDRLSAAAAEFGISRTYDEAKALFADPELDGVILAVPNHLHAEMAIQALQAGKHVLVEKPMARTSDEARAMIEARDRAGRILMVGMNQRFVPAHLALAAKLAEGLLGDVYYGTTRWLRQRPGDGLWERGDWFLSAEVSGGGPMIDLGVHRLDLALFMMDFPQVESVTAAAFHRLGKQEGKRHGRVYDIEDAATALIRFAGDKALLVEASYVLNCREDVQETALYAERGGIRLGAGKVDSYMVTERGMIDVIVDPRPSAPSSCVEHFANVILGWERLVSTAEQGLLLVQLMEAIYQSAATGEMIKFS